MVISVNPYKPLPLYEEKVIAEYRSRNIYELPPHMSVADGDDDVDDDDYDDDDDDVVGDDVDDDDDDGVGDDVGVDDDDILLIIMIHNDNGFVVLNDSLRYC